MIKKIIFSLIVFSTLFIAQGAFASDFEAFATYENGIIDFSQMQDTYPLTTDPECSFYCTGSYISSADIYKGSYLDKTNYQVGSYTRILWVPSVNYSHFGELVSNFLLYQNPADGDYWVDISFANREVWNNPVPLTDKAFFTFSVLNGNVVPSVPPLVSDISNILLPDNTSLDEVIEPISAPAGLNVYFTNYEINPYQYLHINLITCTNGINEGCNSFNETERFFNIDISDLGYSKDKDDLLLYRFNLQGLVTQNDYISVSYKLSNCDYNISVCPEGYSAGRSYQFLVNNSLTEGTWVDFEDENRPECTFARLDVCFMNAMRWLFLPSPQLVSDITSITFSNRVPFSYIYDLDDLYEEAFNDTPKDINISIPFGSFGNITLLSTEKLEAIQFQGTVRTVMGAILIFGTAMLIYRKVLTINDKREVVEKQ